MLAEEVAQLQPKDSLDTLWSGEGRHHHKNHHNLCKE